VKKMKKSLLVVSISILLIVLANDSFAQMSTNYIEDENTFQMLYPTRTPIRQPAEFEPMQSVLIRYPFGISYEIIAEMAEDDEVITIVSSTSEQTYIESQYQSQGINLDHCSFLIAPTDSYWTRDYGPWFIFNEDEGQGVIDFTYNRPRPNDNAIPSAYANDQGLPLYNMPLEHAGGNYMTDGQGISISTDLVWTENPGLTHSEIDGIVNDYLGIHTYHVVPDVNGQYIKHIDCWAKYLAPDKIMIRDVPQSHSQYNEIEAAVAYFESQTSSYDTPYEIVRIYTPNDQPYTNSLILNDKVLIPITGSQWDDDAIESYENAMPGYEILGFTGSWVSTDALHCRTKGIPDRSMLYIEHIPLSGVQENREGYDIQAKIYPYSGESLISDSTCVHWKIEGGSWSSLEMEPFSDDYYHAVIPPQEEDVTIYYYIHADDNSGRSENHPYMGISDPHSFIASGDSNNAPDKPRTPEGPSSGKPGVIYTYSTDTNDPEEDQVFYMWDWGDENFSSWLGPYDSGEQSTETYSWNEKGTYSIRVKAKDIYGKESEWSDPLEVSMPKSNVFWSVIQKHFPILHAFFEVILRI
jgi:agmatine/peptidylarginine deiminase